MFGSSILTPDYLFLCWRLLDVELDITFGNVEKPYNSKCFPRSAVKCEAPAIVPPQGDDMEKPTGVEPLLPHQPQLCAFGQAFEPLASAS